jgi:hypothetical protein
MIRGINSQPYLNLDPYIDVNGFSKLHYKICKGLVMADYKKEGNMVKPGGFNNAFNESSKPAYALTFKPIYQALEEYHALPEDHEIRVLGREIGEYKNRDKFVLFLKMAMGAYDAYQFVFLKTESGGWETRFEEKDWTPDIQYFPELKLWIENLITSGVFEYLGRIIFFKGEHDCEMPMHRDLVFPDENDYSDHRHDFIHIRPNLDKPFYIWDSETNEKVLTEGRAIFFNDQDWHGGGRTNRQTYSLRIDGKFTDEFRKKIGIDHLMYY